MIIKQYDVVLFKTIEEGTILEIFDQENFLVELDNNDLIDVTISDIEKVIWTMPK